MRSLYLRFINRLDSSKNADDFYFILDLILLKSYCILFGTGFLFIYFSIPVFMHFLIYIREKLSILLRYNEIGCPKNV